MTTGKITGEILEAYLNCKTKAHLKLQGEQDTSTDYELLRSEMRDKIRLEAFKKIESAHPEAEVFSNLQATVSTLKRGGVFLEAHIEVSPLHLIIDGLQKAPGPRPLQFGQLSLPPVAMLRGPDDPAEPEATNGNPWDCHWKLAGENARDWAHLSCQGVQVNQGTTKCRPSGEGQTYPS